MHRIQGTYQDSVGQLIAGHLSKAIDSPVIPPYSAIGWIKVLNKEPKIVGQCVLVNYTGSNIEGHLNTPGVFSRQIIRDVYRYVFLQLKCNRLTVKIPEDNERIYSLLLRIGFEYECLMKDYYGDSSNPTDAIQLKLTKNNAMKWLQ